MADQHNNEGSSTTNISEESSESTVELNIKTLNSQIYNFQVAKNMPVSLFKEKIANRIGVPVGQQRLIFRGKVLKDDHLLSEYHVENGHTLHLVERQPSQSQPDSSSGETSRNNGDRGNNALPRGRVGQISHSVVLGPINVGDQGEGGIPDLNRVIGAVLNSIGIGSQTTANGTSVPQYNPSLNVAGQVSQGNESSGGLSQAGNQVESGEARPNQTVQSMPQVMQIPLAAMAIPISVPSIQMPIPDSLNTLSEFMNRMERAFSNGYQPNSLSANTGDRQMVALPSNAQGMPTAEALSIVLRNAQQLLSSRAVEALSHLAGRLEQQGSFSDSTTRGQIQTEAMQTGLAMQHFGAFLLELGRTMMMLRMGQSPAESVVNAGPAIYISPTGPNPIMVQPLPMQNSSFSGASVFSSNSVTPAPVGIGNPPRHVNIHIHAGTSIAPVVSTIGSRASSGEGTQAGRGVATASGDLAAAQAQLLRNISASASSEPTVVATSNAVQPGLVASVSQPHSESVELSSMVSDINARIRNFVSHMQRENQDRSDQTETSVPNSAAGSGADNDSDQGMNLAGHGVQEPSASLPDSMCDEDQKASSLEDVSLLPSGGSPGDTSGATAAKSEDGSSSGGPRSVPLGLGLSSLERKKSNKQPKASNGKTTSTPPSCNPNTRASGHRLLQALASRSSSSNNVPSGQSPPNIGQSSRDRTTGAGTSDGPCDATSAMSQVLQSPALNGLLAGVTEQAGVGSPDALRNMLQQFTQSPVMMNTVNQIAQQVDGRELENMLTGSGGSEGGGIDFSRMVQQMMPLVSRALSGVNAPQQLCVQESEHGQLEMGITREDELGDQNVNLQQATQRIENLNAPGDVFHSMVESAIQFYGSERVPEGFIDELCSNEGLATAYTEMLYHDLQQRLQRHSDEDKC